MCIQKDSTQRNKGAKGFQDYQEHRGHRDPTEDTEKKKIKREQVRPCGGSWLQWTSV
jgi:hypothetical protein